MNYCESCGYEHGPLYICESYSDERKAELRAHRERYCANLQNLEWIKEQLANGQSREAIAAFQALAGVPLLLPES